MDAQAQTEILRLGTFCKRYPEHSLASVRWQIHNERQNGLAQSGAIIRLKSRPDGKRGVIMVDVAAYFRWLRGNARAAA